MVLWPRQQPDARAALKTFFSQYPAQKLKREDEMAVDAVGSELLSTKEFPVTGKNTRNFLDYDPAGSKGNALISLYAGHLLHLVRNLVWKKQGIKNRVSGT